MVTGKIPGWMYFERYNMYRYQSGRRIHLTLEEEIKFLLMYATEFTLYMYFVNGNPSTELHVTRYKE